MPIRMPKLTRTPTGLWTSRKSIPEDVRAAFGKREDKPTWPASLTQSQARTAFLEWLQDIEAKINHFRTRQVSEPRGLTRREISALAGKWYIEAKSRFEDDPGDALGWDAAFHDTIPYNPNDDGYVPQAHIEAELNDLLLREQILVTDESRKALSQEAHDLFRSLCRLMISRSQGDYSEDSLPQSFPSWAPKPDHAVGVSLTELFEKYVDEKKPAPSTFKAYKGAVTKFIDFLGHDDANKVTRSDIVRWKDLLIKTGDGSGPLKAVTVNDIRIGTLRMLFSYGLPRGVNENPALGVEALVRREPVLREKAFSEREAACILKAALDNPPGQRSEGHNLARRWAPWLCAYSGARIGEIVQLRAQDVFLWEDDVWVMRITPEAGKQKKASAWMVPLHDHIIEQGFLDVVKTRRGHLFFDTTKRRGSTNPTSQADSLANKLGAWVRELGVDDPGVKPNHGWRHRFKTLAREYDFGNGAADVIQGHTPASTGDGYGTWRPTALRRELRKLPTLRF